MKTKSKFELLNLISKHDLLEATLQLIDRKSSDSTKKATFQRFIKEFDSYITDQRDVALIAIKVK